jgi:XTP/dITP diphosphohydrolase
MKKIENALGQNPDRNAQFICALSLAWPDGHCDTFEGKVAGKLTFPPRGSEGFGYDPIFIPEGFDITFGEMDPGKKHEMSHRADAFRQLVAACFS